MRKHSLWRNKKEYTRITIKTLIFCRFYRKAKINTFILANERANVDIVEY